MITFQVSYKGKLPTSWVNISFERGTLLNGVSSVVLNLRLELHCSSFQCLQAPTAILLRLFI